MSEKESSKDKLVKTASKLFQVQGYHGTGLNQITKESGAPKGSLYYHFPNGKEQLAEEAVKLTSALIFQRLKIQLAQQKNAAEAIQQAILSMATGFFQGDRIEGVPIATVALETSLMSETLRKACLTAYESWEGLFAAKLVESGYSPDRAGELAIVINALIEGAFILSVTRKSQQPLLLVASQIPLLVKKEEINFVK